MNAACLLILPCLVPAAGLPSPAADPAQPALRVGHELVRVAGRQGFDASHWQQRLSDGDLDARERAFGELVDRAVVDEAARKALEEWSRDARRTELAWTARLALREVERRPGTRLRALRDFGGGAMGDLRERFQELERRFGGLDSMFEDLQRDLDRAFRTPPPAGGTARSQSKSYTLRLEPGEARVEVHEDVDGETKSRTYTGRSLEEILERHPDLRDSIGLHGGGAFRGQTFRFGPHGSFELDPLRPDEPDRWDRPARPLTPGATRTDILGINYSLPTDEERDRLGLEKGVGLKVERTEPGTIAAALGVEPGDVVVELNGRALSGREDVVAVLRERQRGADVRLELVDDHGKRHTLTWKE